MPPNAERSWILYDVANSAYSLIVVTAIFPIFFKETLTTTLPPHTATAYWGYANAVAALVIGILSPVLGPLADGAGQKRRLFLMFFVLGVAATALLSLPPRGAWLIALALFVLSRIGWGGSSLFYDAFLVDVTTPDRMHLVSARGYAYGYIGGTVPFLLIILWIVVGTGGAVTGTVARTAFLLTALWWIFFSLPLLRDVRQRFERPPDAYPVRDSIRRILITLRQAPAYRDAFLFILAYFFYIDGVDTIIAMAAAYGIDAGLGATTLVGAILMIQIVAFPCALLYGRWASRYAAKPPIFLAIAIYLLITLIAFFLPDISSPDLRATLFWVLSFLVATSMGGIQALSRSLFARLIPPTQSAEFFGILNIMGRLAAIMGPFLMGVVGNLAGHSRWGTIPLFALFLMGVFFLAAVREPRSIPPEQPSS